MAVKKDKLKEVSDLATKAIETVAKSLGVATVELWKIFVRQYLVKGAANVFVAVVLYVAAYMLMNVIGLWALIPASIATLIVYLAIPYIGNPQYYAIEDITTRVKGFLPTEPSKSEEAEPKKCSHGYEKDDCVYRSCPHW